MARKSSRNRSKSRIGEMMQELHERVKQRQQNEQAAGKQLNKLSHPQNRWQRAVRYNWDKNRGRG